MSVVWTAYSIHKIKRWKGRLACTHGVEESRNIVVGDCYFRFYCIALVGKSG